MSSKGLANLSKRGFINVLLNRTGYGRFEGGRRDVSIFVTRLNAQASKMSGHYVYHSYSTKLKDAAFMLYHMGMLTCKGNMVFGVGNKVSEASSKHLRSLQTLSCEFERLSMFGSTIQ